MIERKRCLVQTKFVRYFWIWNSDPANLKHSTTESSAPLNWQSWQLNILPVYFKYSKNDGWTSVRRIYLSLWRGWSPVWMDHRTLPRVTLTHIRLTPVISSVPAGRGARPRYPTALVASPDDRGSTCPHSPLHNNVCIPYRVVETKFYVATLGHQIHHLLPVRWKRYRYE